MRDRAGLQLQSRDGLARITGRTTGQIGYLDRSGQSGQIGQFGQIAWIDQSGCFRGQIGQPDQRPSHQWSDSLQRWVGVAGLLQKPLPGRCDCNLKALANAFVRLYNVRQGQAFNVTPSRAA